MARLYCTGPAHIFVGVGTGFPTRTISYGQYVGELRAAGLDEAAIQAAILAANFTQQNGRVELILSVPTGPPRLPLYLGTSETTPHIEIIKTYKAWETDGTGGKDGVGEDDIFVGETALVQCTFSRWNEAVYRIIACAAQPGRGGRGRGAVDRATGIGSLMVRERYAYRLWVQFPFFSVLGKNPIGFGLGGGGAGLGGFGGGLLGLGFNPPPTSRDNFGANLSPQDNFLPRGYRFLRTYLVAPERFDTIGTRPRKLTLTWKCRYETEKFGITGVGIQAGIGYIERNLYDEDMTGLPNPD